MSLPMAKYQRSVCPKCGGTSHKVVATRRSGVVLVRYHWCPCSTAPETVATFSSHETIRRVCRVPRQD